jgi:hypothetical protein
MHDLVFTLALVQVAEYSNPDERQAAAASRALYARRKRVKQHVTFRHPFTPSPREYRTRSTCLPGMTDTEVLSKYRSAAATRSRSPSNLAHSSG